MASTVWVMEVLPEFCHYRPLFDILPGRKKENGESTMKQSLFRSLGVVLASLTLASAVRAQTAPAPAYGMPLGADAAKKVAAAAVAEARKNNFTMAVAVVDTAGNLIY